MTRRRPTAVDLDTILANVTPEILEAVRSVQPAGWQDQAEAAADEVIAATALGLAMGTGASAQMYVSSNDVPDWLRLGALDALCQWAAGTGSTCVHMPTTDRPQPVWAVAWKPGLVVCTGCSAMLKPVGVIEKVCDSCGHVCQGVDAGDPITDVSIVVGTLSYSAGVCNACIPDGPMRDVVGEIA